MYIEEIPHYCKLEYVLFLYLLYWPPKYRSFKMINWKFKQGLCSTLSSAAACCSHGQPHCIFADDESLGCIYFEMFVDKVSKTAENFHTLSTGENGFGYKGSSFPRIIPGFMCRVVITWWHWWLVHLQRELWGWELYPESYKSWLLVHGKFWNKHKQFPVLFFLYC